MEKLSAESVQLQLQKDKWGFYAGIGVFILGIVLLLLVFILAYIQFAAPIENPVVQVNETGGVQMSMIFGLLVIVKAVFLIVMGFCGAWIAGRGVQMYRASKVRVEKE